MTPRYLLDTNIASYIIRGDNLLSRRRLARHPLPEIAISTVTEGELRYGVERKPAATSLRLAVDAFLLGPVILAWDTNAAISYGHLRAQLERAGTPAGSLDTMIAAHALSLGLTLVTNDAAFGRIKELRVEDWSK